MNLRKNLTLAIESALGGGSLSVWDECGEVDYWVGTEYVSKAEDILEGFSSLLERNRLSKDHFKLIAFSAEPGSPTGLKIGSAIAQGLAKSLECQLIGASMWDALAEFYAGIESATVTFPGGKDAVYRRELKNGIFCAESIVIPVEAEGSLSDSIGVMNIGENFAHYLGKAVFHKCV